FRALVLPSRCRMRVALLQLNPVVADFDGNTRRIEDAVRTARDHDADLCVAPELALSGYPPHDLALYDDFVARNLKARDRLLALSRELNIGILFGIALANENPHGKPLRNAAVLCDNGKLLAVKHKALLPTYDVFDERRYFEPDPAPVVADFRGTKIGLLVCEDIWTDASLLGRIDYEGDP